MVGLEFVLILHITIMATHTDTKITSVVLLFATLAVMITNERHNIVKSLIINVPYLSE